MSNSPEVFKGGESTVEAQNAAAERSAELVKNRAEKGVERSPEAQAEAVEKARVEANKEALMSKERGGGEKKRGGEPTATAIKKVTKKQKDIAYKQTLKGVRSQMNAPERTFSKVIHSPVVERTSEVVGNTIARPNSILAGSFTAFIVVSIVYLIAKKYGYALSGFETIGAFAVGWLLGVLFDYLRAMITGGRSK